MYVVEDKGEIIYNGHTTDTVEERLKQHYTDSRGYCANRFHTHLRNADRDDIKIIAIEARSFKCKAEAEDYDMMILDELIGVWM